MRRPPFHLRPAVLLHAAFILAASVVDAQQPAVWTDMTGDRSWETASNWLPAIVPNSSAADVQLSIDHPCVLHSTVEAGSLSLAQDSRLLLAKGTITLDRAGGAMKNAGLIQVGPASGISFGSDVAIFGAGTIALSADEPRGSQSSGQIYIYAGTTVQQREHTISGRGIIRLTGNSLLANSGTIAADQPGQTLTIDSEAVVPVSNDGVIVARDGGTLLVFGGIDQRAGGTILASGVGSVVQQGSYSPGASITGGTLRTENGGVIRAFFGTLSGSTNEGNVEIWSVNGGSPTNVKISGRLTNNGVITLRPTSTGFWNGLAFVNDASGTVTLDGTGELRLESGELGGAGYAEITGDRATLRNASSHLIHGYGSVNFSNTGTLINDGTLRGDVPGRSLAIDGLGSPLKNNGIIEAVNGGIVGVEGAIDQTGGGVISADGQGSYAAVQAVNSSSHQEVVGGTFRTSNGGIIYAENNAVLNGGVNEGTMITGSAAGVKNFTNNGTVTISSSTSFALLGDLGGSGSLNLAGQSLSVSAHAAQLPNHSLLEMAGCRSLLARPSPTTAF
ncbi:MAG: hypothetical protein ACJ8I9_00285 [Chthoniobacterales bacterium]